MAPLATAFAKTDLSAPAHPGTKGIATGPMAYPYPAFRAGSSGWETQRAAAVEPGGVRVG
jgi:hypothetical protein